MTVYLSPIGNDQVVAASTGIPLVGGYWNVFLAGTSTPVVTYVDSAGVTQQPTNIVLDAAGRPANPIWLSGGIPVKFRLFSAAAVPLLTIDNVSGVNDPAGITAKDQWVLYGAAPTYISGTSFSLVGDQTATFQIGRRVKTTNTGGTVYSSITNSVFGAVTTVTVSNDAGSLDSGLSAVSYGVISSVNTSAPSTLARSGANTDITSLASATTVTTQSAADNSTKIASTAYADRVSAKIQPITASVAANALTLTLNPTVLDFRSATLTSGTVNSRSVPAAISVVVPDTALLGTVNATAARLVLLAIDNAGTVELAVINIAGGVALDETGVISTTSIGTGADSAGVAYSTTGRSNVAYRVVGFVDITEATAGTWATAPSTIQGAGGQALAALSSLGYGQTWQNVGGSRSKSTTYYNTTGKPIAVSVIFSIGVSINAKLTVGGVDICQVDNNGTGSNTQSIAGIVPPGQSYSVTSSTGTVSIWAELR